ncbi:MAG TPA: hypothetical protein VGR35_13360 [Tepidisphaeraceae bacterium]|nr:hypothetical protein [Tepidisphaeraceae bacterium]
MSWKWLSITALFLAGVATLGAEEKSNGREEAEPPLRIEVEIGGKTVAAEPGKRVEVEVEGKKISLRINVLPHRQFDRAGVRFLYPASCSWEVDRDEPGVTIYTMDGNDSVLMLMKYDVPLTPEQAVDAMLSGLTDTYDKANVKRLPTTLNTENRTLKGTRLAINLAGERLHQDIFGLKAGGATLLLMLQDSVGEDGKPTTEMQEMRELLTKTLELKPAAAE